SVPKVLRDRRFVGRRESIEDARGGGRAHTFGAVEVFDAERQTFQWPCIALVQPHIARFGLRQRPLRRRQYICIERAVAPFDRRDKRAHQLGGREPLFPQSLARLRQRDLGKIAHSPGSLPPSPTMLPTTRAPRMARIPPRAATPSPARRAASAARAL